MIVLPTALCRAQFPPSVVGLPDLETASRKMGEQDLKARKKIGRPKSSKPALETGEIVLLREETGSKKGNFITEC